MALNISLSLFLVVAVVYAIIFKLESMYWKKNCKIVAIDMREIYETNVKVNQLNSEVLDSNQEIIETNDNIMKYAKQVLEQNNRLISIINSKNETEN